MADIGLYRENIDKMDILISECLERRLALSREIGKIKKENGNEVRDEKREEEIVKRLCTLHPSIEEELRKVYSVIFETSRNVQEREE